MPSPSKSTRNAPRAAFKGPLASDLALLAPPERARARSLALELVSTYRKARRPLPPQTLEYAVELGIFASPTDADLIATRLVPDLSTDQARELAAAKDRIGRLVATLRAAQAEVGEIVARLQNGNSSKTKEPPVLECTEADQVAALRPGRRQLDLTGALTGIGPGWVFTVPTDDLAEELKGTEADFALTDIANSLSDLAERDENSELLRRRGLLADRLSDASDADTKPSAA